MFNVEQLLSLIEELLNELGEPTMPEINITLSVRVSFREKAHRETIVQTVIQGAQQVLTNINMLTPSNNRIAPRVTMLVTERGEEDREIDIASEMAQTYAEIEDPFA